MTPLHPAMQALVSHLQAAGMPPDFAKVGVAAAREMGGAAAAAFGQGPAMARVEEIEIDVAGGRIPARCYLPETDAQGLIVYLHGGGWVLGDIEGYDAVCRMLARDASCAVLSIGYRLAPEHAFPVPVEDCYRALLWGAAHRENLVGGLCPLVVAGDSAGGNLAAVMAILARDRGGPRIAMQVLLYPVTDARFDTASYVEHAENGMLSAAAMRWFWDQYLADPTRRADPLAAPLRTEDLAGLPAALVELASHDPLLDEGQAYADRLAASGVPVRTRLWSGMCHGFFQLAPILPPAAEAVAAIAADLRAGLMAQAGAPRPS